MAAQGELDRQILADSQKGYHRFIGMMRWGAVVCAIAAVIVVIVIQ
jgi:hypothetical protein